MPLITSGKDAIPWSFNVTDHGRALVRHSHLPWLLGCVSAHGRRSLFSESDMCKFLHAE